MEKAKKEKTTNVKKVIQQTFSLSNIKALFEGTGLFFFTNALKF